MGRCKSFVMRSILFVLFLLTCQIIYAADPPDLEAAKKALAKAKADLKQVTENDPLYKKAKAALDKTAADLKDAQARQDKSAIDSATAAKLKASRQLDAVQTSIRIRTVGAAELAVQEATTRVQYEKAVDAATEQRARAQKTADDAYAKVLAGTRAGKLATPGPALTTKSSPGGVDWSKELGQFGGVKVTITKVELGNVSLKRLNGTGPSADKLLIVKVNLENANATKKINYGTWRATFSDPGDDNKKASATDDSNNTLKRIRFGLGEKIVDACNDSVSIYPGKTIDDVLVFESPVDGATKVKLTLPQKNLGLTGEPIVVDLPLK